jgi:hypothetical protein
MVVATTGRLGQRLSEAQQSLRIPLAAALQQLSRIRGRRRFEPIGKIEFYLTLTGFNWADAHRVDINVQGACHV